MNRRIVITGMGCVTPLGAEVEDVWKKLLAGTCGIRPTTLFDAKTFPTTFAAEVKALPLAELLGDEAEIHASASRNARFALAAGVMAWRQAGLDHALALDHTRMGVYLGGGEGPLDFAAASQAAIAGCRDDQANPIDFDSMRWASAAMELLNGERELEQEPNLAAAHVASLFNLEGPNFNTLTACAASTQAIGEASNMIQYGDADVMLTGGTHSMIHPIGVTGFNRLTALSTRNDDWATASRPFDRSRDGFVLGEGAGIVVLEELSHAQQRGASIMGEIVGFGSTADAYRVTDIHAEGRGPIGAMRAALHNAGLGPSDIDYISAHGTGTEENDKIETRAIREVFGDKAPRVPISSIKSMLGHLIAAAGAVELITCVLAIRDGMAPPTMHYTTPDPNCDLDYIPNQARKMKIRAALSNSFGFGGQNNAIVVQAFTP